MGDGSRIIAGAMSGTSADGVDVAVCRITGRGVAMSIELLLHHARAYPISLRERIFRIKGDGRCELRELAELGREITLKYATAVREAIEESGAKVDAIAAHGQTLFHSPPNTIQWFDPALLAAEIDCAVVSDFRRADCAAGGQGAPLVPFADYVLFRHATRDRALVHIGGIANVTLLPADGGIETLLAFDTGPGNCVCDYLMRRHDPRGKGFDEDGRIARSGSVNMAVVDRVVTEEYFKRSPAKSTDGPEMIALFQRAGGMDLSFAAGLATACQITATTLAEGIMRFARREVDEVIVSGGGAKNPVMIEMLRRALGNVPIRWTDDLGVPGDAKEAMAFALLGAATLDGEPSNVPSCTGARRAVVLGSITPKP
jgi:anhydro-N-acetylmuramic acid kinase